MRQQGPLPKANETPVSFSCTTLWQTGLFCSSDPNSANQSRQKADRGDAEVGRGQVRGKAVVIAGLAAEERARPPARLGAPPPPSTRWTGAPTSRKVQGWLGRANVSTARLYERRRSRPEDSPTFRENAQINDQAPGPFHHFLVRNGRCCAAVCRSSSGTEVAPDGRVLSGLSSKLFRLER